MASNPLNPQELPDQVRQYFEKRLLELREAKTKNSDLYETQFNYIAGGALAGTTFILEKLVTLSQAVYKPCLYSAWGLLISSLIGNLLTALISARVLSNEITQIEQVLIGNGGYNSATNNKKLQIIHYCNYISLTLLLAGLVFFFIFIALNTK